MRSERGSITVYVLLVMLTFTAFLMAIYVRNSNTEMAQIETAEQIKQIYENYNIDEIYATMTGVTPQILGYERGAKEITIKTLVENGLSIDQNGKEILYYAATLSDETPTEISETKGVFGKWQKSKEISVLGNENADIYIWIKNEDGNVSEVLENPISSSEAQIKSGEYAKGSNKIYIDPVDATKVAYIPAGFTVSNVTGETSISDGLVIYSGNHEGANMNTIQDNVNQYVWIPVDKPYDMYGTNLSGNKLGKLYTFDTSGTKKALNWLESSGYMEWREANNREPVYLTNDSIDEENVQSEFDNMIESIEKYKGFYIGRYELTGTASYPTVVKSNTPLVSKNWYTLYQACNVLENKTSSKVKTTMIWGNQWDQAIEKSIKNKQDFLSNPNKYGVYSDSTYFSEGVTGRMESAYNIFDMGGNVFEWTQEGYSSLYRVIRGGDYNSSAVDFQANSRNNSYDQNNEYGCRAQLYLL